MTDTSNHVVITGSDPYSGLPYVIEPADVDQWPSLTATVVTVRAICEIVARGYDGVRIEAYRLSDGRVGYNFFFDNGTPEGPLAEELLEAASTGLSQPVATTIAKLERIYRERGLPIPTKTKPAASGR